MRHTVPTAALGVAVCAGAMLVGAAGASAATKVYVAGYAGGSLVRSANNTITSDLTAASKVTAPNTSRSNTTASTTVAGLLNVNAISTSSASKAVSGGQQVTSESKVSGLNALGGLITAQTVDTKTVTQFANGKGSASSSTTFVGLKIAGVKLPVTIGQNYRVSVLGIANITLNTAQSKVTSSSVAGLGSGIRINLLKARGTNGPGATVLVTPAYGGHISLDVPETGHTVGGASYGTSVNAAAGSLVGVRSDPTAPNSLHPAGSGGKVITTTLASADLSPTVHIGAVTNTVSGTNSTALGESQSTSYVGKVNLLNGLVTADAVGSNAHVRAPTGSTVSVTGGSRLANLKIGGEAVPVTTASNTKISLGSVATVTVNQQVKGRNAIIVRALDITLTTKAYGLPAGAEIQVAVAVAAAT